MIDVFASTFTTLKSAKEIAQGLIAMKTDAAVREEANRLSLVIADAIGKLVEAQTARLDDVKRIETMERELARLKEWSDEKRGYELHKTAGGALVYRSKAGNDSAVPAHELCADCYTNSFKSFLQPCGHVNGAPSAKCHRCGAVVPVDPAPKSTVEFFSSEPRRGWRDVF